MRNLLYKEFRLSVHPFYFVLPVIMGALMLIPQWLYFLVPLYFCFISLPNLMAMYKSNNDIAFSVILPVAKRDIVRGRITAFVLLELMHVAWAAVFAMIHRSIYSVENFSFNLNIAFFGITLILFGIVNIVIFPIFYRTAYRFGFAVIAANIAALLFAASAELLVVFSERARILMEQRLDTQLITLAAGIALFSILTVVSYRISANRFEQVDV